MFEDRSDHTRVRTNPTVIIAIVQCMYADYVDYSGSCGLVDDLMVGWGPSMGRGKFVYGRG